MDTAAVKIVFVGDSGVGKTAMLQNLFTQTLPPTFTPTEGTEINRMFFRKRGTQEPALIVNLWDIGCNAGHRGICDGYFIGATAMVVAFDVTSVPSFYRARTWRSDVSNVAGDIPCALLGVTTPKRRVGCDVITAADVSNNEWTKNAGYFEASLTDRVGVVKPIHWLVQRLAATTNTYDVDLTAWQNPQEKNCYDA